MKTPAIQNQLFYPIYVRKKTQKTDVNHDCKKFDIPYAYYPPSLSFGIANSGKLKTLFTYELPCMYTGIDMIDPKKIQKMLKNNLLFIFNVVFY